MPEKKPYSFCSVSKLKKERRITKWIDELRDEISAFFIYDEIIVISSVCPHFGGDFDFDEKKCHLTCRWHGWKFDLKTGKSLTNYDEYKPNSLLGKIIERGNNQLIGCFPYKGQLQIYDFRINGDDLEVLYQ